MQQQAIEERHVISSHMVRIGLNADAGTMVPSCSESAEVINGRVRSCGESGVFQGNLFWI